MDRESWWATVHRMTESDTTEVSEQEAQKTDQDLVKLTNKPVKSFAQKNDPILNFKNLYKRHVHFQHELTALAVTLGSLISFMANIRLLLSC